MSKLLDTNTQRKTEYVVKNQMPSFATRYFRYNRDYMTVDSLYGYALDMASFFSYIQETHGISLADITIKYFEGISVDDIENYLQAMSLIDLNGETRSRSAYSMRRKFNVLNSFYHYYFIEGYIEKLPTLRVDAPKKILKAPNLPSDSEIKELIEYIEFGNLPSHRAAAQQEQFRTRDTAIIKLICYAGLKTTECLGLDLTDLHLDEHFIYVKSRLYSKVIITDEVVQSLSSHLNERMNEIAMYGDDNALFITERGNRMGSRTLQVMIKKYTTALFGEDKVITARDLGLAFKDNVWNDTKSVVATSRITGSTIDAIKYSYTADLKEMRSKIYY